ncbi:Acetyl-coenzyme A carboxyl transferase alpha chain / Acetyl-coenzyme A carboxyl transferase beta chain [Alloactinosynnema sp. L-07]|uniref:carboxyl transferase domain-containing protein n=1 Tax=Alloactinosynnema sp. L-07 TaxID=1653480 RepID=UPI00065F049B|nr:carboxyl transferase domain-containing protein [Alloactinosynnema sp. L-07]CRK59960.1 Acetyl-coenzyme A carboxyl transferase alpha chain / Acetyl-coenzyme A carboxyl transferase beta chain [Alloactinosynnema sp. L-07]
MPDEGARHVIAAVASDFVEFPGSATPGDGPIGWEGYGASKERAMAASGETESVVCGEGKIGGTDAVLIVFDFRFLGGSVGTKTGDRIEHAFTRARETRTPLVSLIATGGSRMHEGMLSLRQLQRVARQSALLREAGVPQVSVLRDPTTGGLWASLGAGADVTIGVAGARVGFAGSRVRPAVDVDDPAYTSEGQFANGHIDEVCEFEDLGAVLAEWLVLLTSGTPEPPAVPRALGSAAALDGWAAVRQARSAVRPHAESYLDDYFDLRREISGDRAGGVDPGMLCGIGLVGHHAVAYAAQTGTATTPSGFRLAARLIRLAERLDLAVLTLVDTPGAANDAAAERAGVGPAIADLFATVAAARVPITTLVIGEGGSGGALALAAPDRTWITPDAYFSVIAPELCAAILKRDASEIPATAEQLRLRPQDLLDLGVVRGIAY